MRRFLLVLVLITNNALSALPAETLIFRDEFTGSNGTDLVSRSPNTGTSWSEVIDSTGSLNIQIESNQARASANSSNDTIVYVANPASSVADMRVAATMAALATGNDDPAGLVFRYVDNDNFYACMLQTTTAPERIAWLDKRVGGVYDDSIDGGLFNISANDVVSCAVVGTSLEMRVNGDLILSATDSDLSSAGKGGIYMGDYPTCTTCDIVTSWLLDDFEVYEITADAERRIW